MPTLQQVEDCYSHDPEYEYRDPIGYAAFVEASRRDFRRFMAAHDAEVARAAKAEAFHFLLTHNRTMTLDWLTKEVATDECRKAQQELAPVPRKEHPLLHASKPACHVFPHALQGGVLPENAAQPEGDKCQMDCSRVREPRSHLSL